MAYELPKLAVMAAELSELPRSQPPPRTSKRKHLQHQSSYRRVTRRGSSNGDADRAENPMMISVDACGSARQSKLPQLHTTTSHSDEH